jgi:glucan 1,3-beta-glucosidase
VFIVARRAGALFVIVAALVVAFWWWLGEPIAMPSAPLAPGDKLYCLSYTPFRDAQTPLDLSTRVDPRRIDEDLARLARLTRCIRTYSADLGLDQVAPIAQRHGLKVLQGLWLGSKAERNRTEMDRVVALANQFRDVIEAVVVGNEVLLRGELSAGDLANLIREVKGKVPVPVTYADVWEFWLRNPVVYNAVDFVTIHILPYWEDFPIPADNAAAHVDSIRKQVLQAFPTKEVLIGEVGWPSAGRMREGALPSPANQARVIQDVLALAQREGFHVNVIEAFDQPWKRQLEGTVGGHWGLLDAGTRTAKFAWGAPVSNHPDWPWQAVVGVVLAGCVFATALIARRWAGGGMAMGWGEFAGIAICAGAGGILIGWTLANVPVESLGVGGWTGSLVLAALAIAGPIAGAAGIANGTAVPAFAHVIGPRERRVRNPLARALGIIMIVLAALAVQVALGLVFDPRYRDFPFAPFTAAVVPFLTATWLQAPAKGRRGVAETVTSASLVLAVIYIVPNESLANWQSLWLCADFAALGVILLRIRGEPG